MMEKIKSEGLEHSQVMNIAFNLTDSSGPRLTTSAGFMRAANYAKNQLAKWGLVNATLDPWGEFGKSWQLVTSYVAMSKPYYRPLNAFPKAWCIGTNGFKRAEVMLITAKDSTALDAYKGKLADKILILDRDISFSPGFTADSRRYTDAELDSMSNLKPPDPNDSSALVRRREYIAKILGPTNVTNTLKDMAKDEGAVAVLSTLPLSHDGTLFVQGGGFPENFTDVQIGVEDYLTILRLLRAGVPVKIDIDVAVSFSPEVETGYNVVAEIPGTDPKLKNEVVMVGAHLDSWQGATGATDNAAGSAVMMEAMRILEALNVQPKRTIRIALWSGEEQGLLGSKAYVKKTFGDPATMKLLPAQKDFDVYFNVDNGTGKIRGIYLQGNEKARNIFAQWFTPFENMGAKWQTIINTGGTDHLSFDAVGLPGFQFIQDPIEYSTRTHHTTMDSYDHLLPDDLKQMATIVAAFVYNAAEREEKIPRKPLPAASQ